MTANNGERPIEAGIRTDFSSQMSYGGYLELDRRDCCRFG